MAEGKRSCTPAQRVASLPRDSVRLGAVSRRTHRERHCRLGSRGDDTVQWNVRKAGDGIVALQCVGTGNGPKWLDGRTADGTVGLAPSTENPFTGTRWEVVSVDDNNPDIVALKCLATIEGARWLDGRTGDGSVGLAPTTDAPFTGTKWEVKIYPALM